MRQIPDRLPSSLRILRQAGSYGVVQRLGRHRLRLADRGRLLLQDRRGHAQLALSLEGAPAGQHLVEHRAQRKDVAPPVDVLSIDLLRGHVLERSHPGPFGRQRPGHRLQPGAPRVGGDGRLRQAEVQQLGSRLRQHDVSGLEIAMHDAAAMRRFQPLAQLESALQKLIQRQRPLVQPIGQRLPLQVLHDEKAQAVLRADVVKVADVRMVQGGDGPCLPLEPLPGHRFVRQAGR